ncbi:hypothetical protein AM587_10000693 [Phytophthora nicotianae]|uniref:SWIM-type domain-containing protein n=1 Tax=Phytophthora nicotianae TaxID=4792 RepID=A0A0W8CNA1_PHYNI|nr:hypothetical protein AM587_10000693 [Phytophthora nicotianae]
MAIESLVTKRKNGQDWVKGKHTVTPRAKKMFDKQIWRAAVCSVRRSTDSIFYVDDIVGDTDKGDADITRANHQREKRNDHRQVTYTVDLESGSCTRCADRHHIQLPCRHLVAALYSRNGCPSSNAGAYKFFHPAFTVTSYVQAFANVSISMPFVPALLLNTNVRPPPLCNQAGKSSSHKQRDVARREKRIPSRGEPRGPRSKQIQTTSPPHKIESENVAASMRDFFNEEIRSAEKKKKSQVHMQPL